jgi:hypothetical protein
MIIFKGTVAILLANAVPKRINQEKIARFFGLSYVKSYGIQFVRL